MLLITGVDSVESSSRQNATKNRIDRGVAGRSMAASLGIRGCGPPETGSRDSAWWWWWASERTKHRRRLVRWNMRMRGRSRKRATRDAPEVKRRVARAMLAVAWRPRWTAHTRRRGRARGEGAQLGGWQRSAGNGVGGRRSRALACWRWRWKQLQRLEKTRRPISTVGDTSEASTHVGDCR